MLSEAFVTKVLPLLGNKESLVTLMNEIDETKRQEKAKLTAISSGNKKYTGLRGHNRKRQIESMQEKIIELTEEREYVRSRINSLNQDLKALRKANNSRKEKFCHAFVAAAERDLDEETFLALESRAMTILSIEG